MRRCGHWEVGSRTVLPKHLRDSGGVASGLSRGVGKAEVMEVRFVDGVPVCAEPGAGEWNGKLSMAGAAVGFTVVATAGHANMITTPTAAASAANSRVDEIEDGQLCEQHPKM
ncbi:hypothetical protein HK101_009346, partial [Irineochytrium annulatum]